MRLLADIFGDIAGFIPLVIFFIVIKALKGAKNSETGQKIQKASYYSNTQYNTYNPWKLQEKCYNCDWDNCKLSIHNIRETKKKYQTEEEINTVLEDSENYCIKDL